jgi:multiple sugar transport system ATP-binding protein
VAKLVLRGVRKRFEDQERDAVCGMDLEVGDGELLVLVGPSGCGKTTTLRVIAGLEEPSEGEVWIGSRMVNGVAPKDRDVAFVFQSYALYPHMSVFDNMAFGLRMRGTPRDEVRRRVEAAAALLGITDLLGRRPAQLSGGQRQRVATGRAIVRQPQLFLFDEPLSNLDAKLRAQMRTEIKRLHQSLGATMVYVTHDQVEAMTLASRIVVMNAGRVEQVGAPAELYSRPATRFVAGFIGSPAMNFVPCLLRTNGAGLAVEIEGAALLPVPSAREAAYRAHAGRRLILGLRPEHLAEHLPGAPAEAVLSIEVEVLEPQGIDTMAVGRVASVELCARLPGATSARRGARLSLSADMTQMHLIDPETDQVIQSARSGP